MDYSFTPYLERLSANWFDDDDYLKSCVAPARHDGLHRWGALAATKLRALADESELPENRPRLVHYGAFNRRIDDVVLAASTREAQGIAHGGKLGFVGPDARAHYAAIYLVNQNAEAGVACSLACTNGMERALRKFAGPPALDAARSLIVSSTPEKYAHGAQFVTEIQGGSDVAANSVIAKPDGNGAFRLFGEKWFCSNITADFYLVTARPEGAPDGGRGVGLFLVPARSATGERNGIEIRRLKNKLGSRALPTAECAFSGALAHAVGPLDAGIGNVVGIVLTTSRYDIVVSSAAMLRRAERELDAYADFRTAFGRKVASFPLVRELVERVRDARRRILASAFSLADLWDKPESSIDFRLLVALAKVFASREASTLLHEAVSVFAGNAIEEEFTPIARLLRDSIVNETWEGPYSLLISHTLKEMRRFKLLGRLDEFVARHAGPRQGALVERLARELRAADDDDTAVLSFAETARDLITAFQRHALER
jgi:alkylation response protein AidB-like acyl-CoA dehydrogenase